MTITKLYTDILDSIVRAQYNAYVYSQKLGEQVTDNLFPIPIAEIKEITLDVNFAYTPSPPGEEGEIEVSLPDVYNNLKPLFVQVISKVCKRIADEIDMSDYSDDAGWLPVKKSLLHGTLDQYILTALKQEFFNDTKKIIRNNAIDQPLLEQLLIKVAGDTILHHPDVKKFIRGIPAAHLLKETVEREMRHRHDELQKSLENAKQERISGLDIIIDAGELKELPRDAIQHARVVLDVRSILNENEPKP
jgi:hypothetical protein